MKRLVLGPRAVEEALRADRSRVHVVYVVGDARGAVQKIAERARGVGVLVESKSTEALDALAKGLHHQGVVALTGDYPYRSLEEVTAGDGARTLVLCDGIEDPGNLGAILRAAVFFGADGVVIPKHRAAPVTAGVVRSSAGASEHARVARVTNLADTVAELGEQGFATVALVPDADEALWDIDLRGDVALVVGGEHAGVRQLVRRRASHAARLPGVADVASLNAAAATAAALYEVQRQRARTVRS